MRYSKIIFSILTASSIFISIPLEARAKKGFHTGPYLTFEFGVMQADFDRNEVSGIKNGNDFEPAIGFLFGWNVWDFFSAEMQGRYSTNRNSDRREHIAAVGLFGKWSLVTDALTDFKHLRILPFVKGGLASRIAVLPADPNSNQTTVTSWGIGPSIGGGVSFLLYKYFYFGLDIQEDIIYASEVSETVSGVPNTLVYKGGFHPSFGAMLILGVHY